MLLLMINTAGCGLKKNTNNNDIAPETSGKNVYSKNIIELPDNSEIQSISKSNTSGIYVVGKQSDNMQSVWYMNKNDEWERKYDINQVLNIDKEAYCKSYVSPDGEAFVLYNNEVTCDFGDNVDFEEYYDWENGINPDFLYQPLVDIVDGCKEIDFCNPSEEKWDFAVTLLATLGEIIKQLPEDIFLKNNFKKENILFFSTMDSGDYMQEMLDVSIKKFNAKETLELFESL